MSVLRLLLGKKRPEDRPALSHHNGQEASQESCSELATQLTAFLEDIRSDRLKMSSSEDAIFLADHRALTKEVSGALGVDSGSHSLIESWKKARAFATQRKRQEEIFVEGRFFEYQQILFDFARLFRQLEQVRTSTLKHVRSMVDGEEIISKEDLEKFSNLLEREAKELRSAKNAVNDRIQTVKNILLEDRTIPEINPLTGLLSAEAFRSAISRYLSVSACTGESLNVIRFDVPEPGSAEVIKNAIEQTFRRQTDCKGMITDNAFGVLILNVTRPNVKVLMDHVVEFVASAEKTSPVVSYATARHDDTPDMLLARCESQ